MRRRRCYQRSAMGQAIRILGIDPGLRRTGWGLIGCEGNRLIYLACGSVESSDKLSLAERLVTIHDGLTRIVDEFRPDEAAVEATFVNRDATATLKLGQARGIALLVPAKAGVSVAEYAPNLVKKTIVGAGHAEEAQIRLMVGVLLPKADPQSEDAPDALPIAATPAHHPTTPLHKAPKYADLDPAVVRLAGQVEERRAPQPVADAVSALVNLGYGQPQAAAAIAAASRSAGEGAETTHLIRLGLKELAK